MNVTLKLKLSCSTDSSIVLKDTIKQFTDSYNRASLFGYNNKTANAVEIQKSNYYNERSLTQLPSQLVIASFAKASESLRSRYALQKKYNAKVLKSPEKYKPKTFNCPNSYRQAVRYDAKRAGTVNLKEGWATLASTNGRQLVNFTLPKNFNKYEHWKVCCSELILDNKNRLMLHVILEGDGKPFVPNGYVAGVDLGIKRPAVVSNVNGSLNVFLGEKEWSSIDRRKRNYIKILQSKGTKSAKRQLKKLSGKVNRFRNNCDHVLSKQLVNSVPAGATLVFENLKDIRERCGRGKGRIQNGRMHKWSFARLFEFVEYKARLAGIQIVKVDPRNTSRKCSKCGHVNKKNRQGQSHFKCKSCGHKLNADLNGARNIAQKFAVNDMSLTDGCSQSTQSRQKFE